MIPPGAREGNITVKVRIQINPDGSIAGTPEVMNGPGDFLFDTTARSTVAAILGCQNYDFLPQDQYDVWKDLVLNFNPNMFADATQPSTGHGLVAGVDKCYLPRLCATLVHDHLVF